MIQAMLSPPNCSNTIKINTWIGGPLKTDAWMGPRGKLNPRNKNTSQVPKLEMSAKHLVCTFHCVTQKHVRFDANIKINKIINARLRYYLGCP